jgi:acyl dehydratase
MTVRELRSSPSMAPLFARAGAALVPGAARLPLVGRAFGGGSGAGEIPDLTLALRDVAVDRDRLASYDRVCGFTLRDELPATYPHMLAFAMHLALMTDASFPFGPIGLVHVSNRIVQHRPVSIGERLSLTVSAGPLEPHPRGRQFSILTEARVGEELVWEEVSTNLKRGSSSGSDSDAPAGPVVQSARDLPATATWKLPGDLGRRYGSVSGDLNPIHVHPLTARLFGFPAAIAHGMWTKARCLAALESRLPEALAAEVAFKRPILLPATVEFAATEPSDDGEIRFGVRSASTGKAHLDGRISLR